MSRRLRAVWLTLGDASVASTRVRALSISDALDAYGVPSRSIVARGMQGRAHALLHLYSGRGRRVVVVQKVLFGRLMLWLLRARARTLVWECDDAVHVGYPGQTGWNAVRTRRLVELTLQKVDLVTTTSPLLAEELRPASGCVVAYLGPAPPARPGRAVRERVVVWLGSKSTEENLALLPDLPSTLQSSGWTCVAVGGAERAARLGWAAVEWTATTQTEWLEKAAVGLMPQRSDEWSDRKAAYKIFEYIAHGVVPVCSDVLPARLVLAHDRLSRLLVADESGWPSAVVEAAGARSELLPLLQNVADAHSVEVCVGRWLEGVGLLEKAS